MFYFILYIDKPFKCSEYLCDRLFKTGTSLINHLKLQHKFKILKNINNHNQTETIRIEATTNEQSSYYSSIEKIQQQSFAFDTSKGSFEITNLNESSVSTDKLNRQNLYDLLLKLQQNDQLKLNNDSHLTSQFYLNSKEIDNLFIRNSSIAESNENLDDLASLEITSLLPSIQKPFECQELCCLLKFVALDE